MNVSDSQVSELFLLLCLVAAPLLVRLVETTGVPFQLTVGWITRKGRDIFKHDETTHRRFLQQKQAASVAEGMPFHLWLTSPAFEILDATFALNLGWARSRPSCQSLVVYRKSQSAEQDLVYHPTVVGPEFFDESRAVACLDRLKR
jgi:hypothetical protein